jgi:hypothetical protein
MQHGNNGRAAALRTNRRLLRAVFDCSFGRHGYYYDGTPILTG